MCLIAWSEFGVLRAIGWHRTTKANVGPHLYGVPQGRGPHFFGFDRTPLTGINPSNSTRYEPNGVRSPPRVPTELNGHAVPCVVCCIPSECPVTLKGIVVGWPPSGDSDGGCRAGVARPTFAFHRMGGTHLTPSKQRRYVMRFHAVWFGVHTVSERQDSRAGRHFAAAHREATQQAEPQRAVGSGRRMSRGRRSNGHPVLSHAVPSGE